MALSEQEQKLLAQLEASLSADDPKLATTLQGHSLPNRLPNRRSLGVVLGEITGATILVAGLQWHWAVSVLGFAIMFTVAVIGFGRGAGDERDSGDAGRQARVLSTSDDADQP